MLTLETGVLYFFAENETTDLLIVRRSFGKGVSGRRSIRVESPRQTGTWLFGGTGGDLFPSCCRYLVHPNTISNFCCVLLCSVAVLLQGSLIFASSVNAGLIRTVVFWQKCWCPNSLVVDKGSFLVLFTHDLKPTPLFFASLCGRICLHLFSVIITCIEPSLHRNSVKPQTA